jgi:hypothetical protein
MPRSDGPYDKVVSYTFSCGENWAITGFGTDWVAFEETSKNGQEDCHMYGEARLVDGNWVVDKDSRDQIGMYSFDQEAQSVEDYFNTHGMPDVPVKP